MIDVKQAVNAASEFMKELYDPDELIDLALEEVELSDDEAKWFITFGFTRRLTEPLNEKVVRSNLPVFDWLPGASEIYTLREYKVIQVDANTGKANSMKIRAI